MQLYPEKYDKLSLLSEEKSFLRTLDRVFSDEKMSYYVLHINPRRKDSGKGEPELFNLLLWKRGILLFRFIATSDANIASLTAKTALSPLVYNMLLSDISEKLEESRYLTTQSGELKYSLGICFLFPNIQSISDLTGLSESEKAFVSNIALFKDDISEIRKNGLMILEKLVPIKEPLLEDKVNNVFQRLCPEITIPRKFVLADNDRIHIEDQKINTADRAVLSYRLETKQIDIINRIERGHQLILACAGSGKSVLLISKCFKIASLNPNQNFLITCYNRNLNNYYQWAIAQAGFTNKNVRCSTFFALCNQLLESNGIVLPSIVNGQENDYYDRLFEIANNALGSGKIKERFAGIFIDEVQIFKPEWYRFCFNLLRSKNPEDYYFIIAGDKSQDIKNNIKRGKAPWQGGGELFPEYRGKTLPIETNYRNSKPINDAIDRYVKQAKDLASKLGVDLISDPELFLRGTAYRSGNDPQLIELKDFSNEGESKAICDAIKRLIEDKGLSEVDIAIVLYNKQSRYVKNWATPYYNLLAGIKAYFIKENWEYPSVLISGESEGATYGSRRGVTVTTIEGSLGLDFRAVVLAGLLPMGSYEQVKTIGDFEGITGEQLTEKQEAFKKNINLLYTGCTRAKDELSIVLSAPRGDSLYMDLLRDSI